MFSIFICFLSSKSEQIVHILYVKIYLAFLETLGWGLSNCLKTMILYIILFCCNLLVEKVIHCLLQVGRERHRFDFEDFDSVPQKFNL